MNARKNFRYATQGAMRQFNQWDSICRYKAILPGFVRESFHCNLYTNKLECRDSDQACKDKLASMPAIERSRFLALQSGGALATNLFSRERLAVVIVGDTLFVHGGLTKDLVSAPNVTHTLEHLNSELSAFFAGQRLTYKGEKVLWNRDYSGRSRRQLDDDPRACRDLNETLARLPAAGSGSVRRMVVGHSVQRAGAVTSACGGAVWRVDVGLSRGVRGGPPQLIEIRSGGRVSVLAAAGGRAGTADGGAGLMRRLADMWAGAAEERVGLEREWLSGFGERPVEWVRREAC